MKNEKWKTVALGDVFDIARGGSPRPIDKFITDDTDGVNWIMISDAISKYITSTKKRIIKEGVKKSREVYPGDFLLTNSMSFGRPYIMQTSGCIHDGWLVLSPRDRAAHPDYFYHLLGSDVLYAEFERRAAGATVKNLNIDLVKGVKVSLPPLAEQKRIAAVLDKAEELRAKRRAALAQLDTLTESIFLEMFGDPVRNPKGWPMKQFSTVCETRLGKMLDQKQQTGEHVRPYLRNANVQWFRFELADVFEMDFDEKARKVFRLQDGDLLICEGGEPGRAAVWRGEIEECYYQKALHCARPRGDLAIAEFLAWQLWFLAHWGGLGDHVTSATIAHLTGEKLKAMKIPIPSITLQCEFARRVTAIEKLKATHRALLAEVNTLFASLQHRAFGGEL